MPSTVEESHRDRQSAGSFVSSSSFRDAEKSSEEDEAVPTSDFFDPNYDPDSAGLEDDSPYPEVRAAVANFDDTEMPVSTLRSWTLGIASAVLFPGLNQFLSLRFPSIFITGFVALVLVYPVGRLWAYIVPNRRIFGIALNGGPFTIKEHVLVTVMAGVSGQSAYATDIIAVQRVYYNQEFNFIYQWMLVMSSQMIGFSIGGIARRFLVLPPSMIWPNTLVECALFNTLHSQNYEGPWGEGGVSRERFFTWAFGGAVVWYIIPGYLFQALSVFTWACWIAPQNTVVNQLFGYRSGLGLSMLSFDWNQIAYTGSPLATPWWAEANIFASFVFFFWIVTPALYYSNVWFGEYLPMSSRTAFDNTGKEYNLTRILNLDGTLNVTAYEQYSPLFLSMTFAVSYGTAFASITALVTHSVIHFWHPIKRNIHRTMRDQPDIHAQLMARYPQVPEWWYACIFAVTFVFACLAIKLWPTKMTIWALVVALLLAFFFLIPIGMIQAITNRSVGINVLSELIVGLMMPGKPIAMMMFKTWAYITIFQAIMFTADFKLGHYMKIPQRIMFWAQILATIIAGTVQLGVQSWMFSNIPDLCSTTQANGFICAGVQVFGTSSVIWGVIGSARQFAKGQIYYELVFFFIYGAIGPVVLWAVSKRWPHSWLNYVNFPLMFAGLGLFPPANASNIVPWAILGFIFQYLIRRRYFHFWAKYNYVLSAALDAGTAIGTILVYFCLQFPLDNRIGENTIQKWWGNTVYTKTADWNNVALKAPPPGHTFGPEKW